MKHTLPDLWVELHLLDREDGAGWQREALCAQIDPNVFFEFQQYPRAKKTCAMCPVRDECREDALEHFDQFGVWGGTDRSERRRIWRERGIEVPGDNYEETA